MRGWQVVRIANIHAIFLDLHIFILQRQGQENAVEKGGVGGINRHAHRYVLTLPAKRVFLFFGVKASLGDDSSLRRFTFGRGKCLVEPPA